MQPIVHIDHVSFSYGSAEGAEAEAPLALDDVSLAIEPGAFVGIIGPSGAGKSTLASVMSGAIPHHYAGRLFGATYVDGRDTCDVTLTDISQIVGSVLQDIDAQMVASVVEDELLFGLENFGVPHDQIETRITETLATIGISDLRDREIATLSGGQKQKVAIAAILALRPRMLVLDEPTAALDPASARMVFETLRTVNHTLGVTVVVIEQMVALLSEFCERIVVMDEGRIALDGTPREVFSHSAELRAIGVDSPRTARVSNSLMAKGVAPHGAPCLTVADAYELVSGVVSRARLGRLAGFDAQAEEKSTSYGAHLAPSSRSAFGAPDDELAVFATAAAMATDRLTFAAHGAWSRDAARAAFEEELNAPRGRHEDQGIQSVMPVVEFNHVGFAYPGGAAVEDLCFAVHPGEIFALIGQNGAGKTTATKLLNGLLQPTEGRVAIAGLDTRDTPVSTIARHAATLFQNPDRQLCKNTVLDEVAFGLELQGVGADEARDRARAVIERFGLPEEAAPFSLSRGQRQMVALASVVVLEPEVIVLDEPTSGLDYRECMTVMETVSEMAARGSAVVMVCHDMEVVSDFADRAAVMADGRIVGCGPVGEIFRNPVYMERASVAPPQVVALSERLARGVSPDFAGIGEVSALVDTVVEMVTGGSEARAHA